MVADDDDVFSVEPVRARWERPPNLTIAEESETAAEESEIPTGEAVQGAPVIRKHPSDETRPEAELRPSVRISTSVTAVSKPSTW